MNRTPEQEAAKARVEALYGEIRSLRRGAALLFKQAIRVHRKRVVDAGAHFERTTAVDAMEGYIDDARELLDLATAKAEEADGIHVV